MMSMPYGTTNLTFYCIQAQGLRAWVEVMETQETWGGWVQVGLL